MDTTSENPVLYKPYGPGNTSSLSFKCLLYHGPKEGAGK